MGDKIKVQLVRANLLKRQLDFIMYNEEFEDEEFEDE